MSPTSGWGSELESNVVTVCRVCHDAIHKLVKKGIPLASAHIEHRNNLERERKEHEGYIKSLPFARRGGEINEETVVYSIAVAVCGGEESFDVGNLAASLGEQRFGVFLATLKTVFGFTPKKQPESTSLEFVCKSIQRGEWVPLPKPKPPRPQQPKKERIEKTSRVDCGMPRIMTTPVKPLDTSIPESLNIPEFCALWQDHQEILRKKQVGSPRMNQLRLEKLAKEGLEVALWRVNRSVLNGWLGLWYGGHDTYENRFRKPSSS